jgi:hypothetical protein
MSIDFEKDYKSVRNLANAINVVREGRIVKERDSGQFLDTDAQLVAIIYSQLQGMQELSTVDATQEALPLTPANQAKPSKLLSQIHGMIDKVPLSEELEVEFTKARKAS